MWIALLLAPCAAPQSTVLSSTPLPTDFASQPTAAQVVEAPDGGAFVALPRASRLGGGSPEAIEVHKTDQAGRLRWTQSVPVPPAATSGYWLDADDAGRAALGYQASLVQGGDVRPAPDVALLDADGSLRWQVALDPVQGEDTRVVLHGVGFTPDGNVLVAGYDLRTPSASGGPDGGAFVRALDDEDGSLLWSRDVPDVERVDAFVDGGWSALLTSGRDGKVRFRLFDGSGAPLNSATDVDDADGSTFVAIASGSFDRGFLFNTKGSQSGWRTGRIDVQGDLAWILDGRLNSGGGGVVDDAGTAWLLDAELGRFRRIRPDGFLSGERAFPDGMKPLGDAVPLARGGFAVAGESVPEGAEPPRPVVSLFGPNGGERARQTFEGAPAALSRARSLTRASDGTLFALTYGSEPGPSGSAVEGRSELVRVAIGVEVSRTTCTPAVTTNEGLLPTLRAFGRDEANENDVHLITGSLPVGTAVMFLNGTSFAQGPAPLGIRGELCIGGGIGRYEGRERLRFADARGSVFLPLDLASTPRPAGPVAVLPGTTVHFQAWYRDEGQGALTGAVAVDFR